MAIDVQDGIANIDCTCINCGAAMQYKVPVAEVFAYCRDENMLPPSLTQEEQANVKAGVCGDCRRAFMAQAAAAGQEVPVVEGAEA